MDTERNSSEGLSSKGGSKAGRKLVTLTNIKKKNYVNIKLLIQPNKLATNLELVKIISYKIFDTKSRALDKSVLLISQPIVPSHSWPTYRVYLCSW